MNKYIRVRPRDDRQGWAVDVYDGRTWTQTHGPMSKDSAHRLAHKFRLNIEMAADRVGAATNEEIKRLHTVIKHKGFSVEDSVALNELRNEVARLTAELHRLAHGTSIEGDGMCEYGLELANLRAELVEATAGFNVLDKDDKRSNKLK